MENRLIEKIKKLFALAGDKAAAPNEAENAMRMANKLLEKHNLSMVDLHNSEDITIQFEPSCRNHWVKVVYNHVSLLYSCKFFKNSEGGNFIVGTISESTTASIVANHLIDSIREAGKGKGVKFCNGAALEIADQCNELIAQRKKNEEVAPGTGLVLADIYATKLARVEDFLNEHFNLNKGKKINYRTSSEGREYGRGLSPNAHIGGNVALN